MSSSLSSRAATTQLSLLRRALSPTPSSSSAVARVVCAVSTTSTPHSSISTSTSTSTSSAVLMSPVRNEANNNTARLHSARVSNIKSSNNNNSVNNNNSSKYARVTSFVPVPAFESRSISTMVVNSMNETKSVPTAAASTTTTTSSSLLSATPLVALRYYHENVIDHYENPRNVGSLDKSAQNVGTGLVGAPACGDVMKLQIQVDDAGKIVEAKFKTFGCGSAIASSSYTTTWLQGKTLDEALKIKNTDIASHLNLPPVKLHCSMLAEDAVKAAISDFKKKQGTQGPKV